MFKIALNNRKPYNYAFFCPVSKLHLTLRNPVGFVHEVTSAISSGLKSGILIDITPKQEVTAPPETPTSNIPVQDENIGKKKRGRKASIVEDSDEN